MIWVYLLLYKIPFIYFVIVPKVNAFSFTISYVMSSGFSLNSYTPQRGLKITQTCKGLLYAPFLFILLENFLHHFRKALMINFTAE